MADKIIKDCQNCTIIEKKYGKPSNKPTAQIDSIKLIYVEFLYDIPYRTPRPPDSWQNDNHNRHRIDNRSVITNTRD